MKHSFSELSSGGSLHFCLNSIMHSITGVKEVLKYYTKPVQPHIQGKSCLHFCFEHISLPSSGGLSLQMWAGLRTCCSQAVQARRASTVVG